MSLRPHLQGAEQFKKSSQSGNFGILFIIWVASQEKRWCYEAAGAVVELAGVEYGVRERNNGLWAEGASCFRPEIWLVTGQGYYVCVTWNSLYRKKCWINIKRKVRTLTAFCVSVTSVCSYCHHHRASLCQLADGMQISLPFVDW